jgi:hypothetical protein
MICVVQEAAWSRVRIPGSAETQERVTWLATLIRQCTRMQTLELPHPAHRGIVSHELLPTLLSGAFAGCLNVRLHEARVSAPH